MIQIAGIAESLINDSSSNEELKRVVDEIEVPAIVRGFHQSPKLAAPT